MHPAIECRAIAHHPQGAGAASPMRDLSIAFDSGMVHLLHGPCGCGRNRVARFAGLLERPASGEVRVFGQKTSHLDESERGTIRNSVFGFLFGGACLLPAFSVAENVAMPLFRFTSTDAQHAMNRVEEALEFCGIMDLERRIAGSLDEVAKHRAAFARAIVHRPRILVGIEPGGGETIRDLARRANRELGLTVIWTAETSGDFGDRLVEMRDGEPAQIVWG